MKESFPLQDFEQNVSEFMRVELDAIAKLIIQNEHHNLTKQEQRELSDKQDRYVAYTTYIQKQVDHLKQRYDK
ncbi:MAG: hypothetical protein KBC22_02625 [Candidatus Pacebacteria bacterium]|nr:hypothetical protein [Candidatus Paceibacterota bacterium]